MSLVSTTERDHRLEAYFATLGHLPLRDALKRSAANWQLYAAVASSAMATITGASAAEIQTGQGGLSEPTASALPANRDPASSGVQFMRAAKTAIAVRDFQTRFFNAAPAQTTPTAQALAPAISPNGVVPVYGRTNTIQAGEWISVYGTNLAAETAVWNNDFPQMLAGTSVEINNKWAYLWFVSPGQINLQAPDDPATGTVAVAVTTAAGSATSVVILSQFAPSFGLLDTKHVAGIILRNNGAGAFGGGTYDILGPTGNSLGYPTVAARAGDNVVLFGFGYGPTTPFVPAGQSFAGQAPLNDPLNLYINSAHVQTAFAGLSGAGVYQINLVIPDGLGSGDVPLEAMVGGLQTQPEVYISLDDSYGAPVGGSGTIGAPIGSTHFVSTFPVGSGSGSFGGSFGGSGGGSSAVRKRYEPRKLRFPPKPNAPVAGPVK